MLATMPAQAVRRHVVPPVARDVYHQLLPDFPASAIQWVLDTHWQGPVKIPLDAIDTRDRGTWAASQEPKKVNKHMELIEQGVSKPVILGLFQGHDKLVILDAHHRFLAYEAMRQPVTAYVGHISPENAEKALTAHAKQYTGSSRLNGT